MKPSEDITTESTETLTENKKNDAITTSVSQKHPKQKKFIIVGIIVGVLLLLVGGSALAYKMWYQNPDKVVHDAIINAVKAKTMQATGNFAATSDQYAIDVSIDGKSTRVDGSFAVKTKLTVGDTQKMSFNVDGSGVIKEGMVYIKLEGVKDTFEKVISQFPFFDEQTIAQMKLVAEKVEGQWISISPSDYEKNSAKVAERQKCITDTMKNLSSNKKANDELVELYKKHQAVEVKDTLTSEDGSLGYTVGINLDKSASLVESVADTTYGEALKKCDSDIDFKQVAKEIRDAKKDSSKEAPRVELWVDRFSHKITKVTANYKEDGNTAKLLLQPKFNEAISIDAPKDVMPLKDLMSDIAKIFTISSKSTPGAQ